MEKTALLIIDAQQEYFAPVGKIVLPDGNDPFPVSGTYWIGERGAIFKNYRGGRPVVLPEADFPAKNYPSDIEPRDHYHDWVDSVIDGGSACSHFAHGGPLTESVLVGAMADRFAGEWLEWDRDGQQFTNNPAATALVKRSYRDGWNVEGLG